MPDFELSPSDFAFLWQECKRCFYLKVTLGFGRPRMAFPQIFGAIDRAMTACYNGRPTRAIAASMPGGTIRSGQKWVHSRPIELGVEDCTCSISGRLDSLLELDDGTWGVIDFKTSRVSGPHIPMYSRQLHAYAYALENPASGRSGLEPITKLGLLVYEPSTFEHTINQAANLAGEVRYIDIPRNDTAFLDFLRQVLAVLSQPAPPEPAPDCPWCAYRRASRESGL